MVLPSRGLKLIGVRFYPCNSRNLQDIRDAKCIQKSLYGKTDWFYFNKEFDIVENDEEITGDQIRIKDQEDQGDRDQGEGSGGQELLYTLLAQYIPSKIVIHA